MDNHIQNLDSNESILLMYLAGELPSADRAEVEQMLATDAGLRAQLEHLRTSWDRISATLAGVDSSATRRTYAESSAINNASMAIRQWQVERADRVVRLSYTKDAPPSTLRFPWWAYPSAAAACVLVAFLVWWGNKPLDNSQFSAGPSRGALVAAVEDPEETRRSLEDLERAHGVLFPESDANLRDIEQSYASSENPEDSVLGGVIGLQKEGEIQ